MNKRFTNLKKKAMATTLALALCLSSFSLSFADSSKVVTLGANLKPAQKEQMLKYFGVNQDEAVVLEVNNTEERKYLQGVASEQQLGKITISCSYVEPTSKGSGINVKTANLTWVTSSMIATTLSTAGIVDANVIVAAPFPVSGTGGLTGVMKAFEDATGKPLPEDKKELATEELITTGDLGDDIGQDKATGVINDIKTEIIKNGTKDTVQIAETINNITNNYNITLSPEQQKQVEGLMSKIAQQDYDYSKVKDTLSNVSNIVDKNLSDIGESVKNSGIFDTIKGWFSNLFGGESKDLGILENTNDSLLGDNAQIDATDKNAINLPSSQEVEGFFAKIWNWFTGLFNDSNKNESENSSTTPQKSEYLPGDESSNSNVPASNEDNASNPQEENNNSTDNNASSKEESSTSEIPPAQ
ncbi:DUF1002 domain-containing protein [[Clostridium] dakarense]|uniref:DUF1002 domain-containing protein n=1 Tax=Faecalimicrobium dakarense TaxID=1301100 RepID=UPI0004AE8353|nr:DUF1002 domain-containing protein [[Clostridium] dakarense]